MRVLLLTGEYPPGPGIGGIARYTEAAAAALVASGHEVHVVVTGRHERHADHLPPPADTALGAAGPTVHRRRLPTAPARGRTPARLADALATAAVLRRLGHDHVVPDVVEAPDWQAGGLGPLLVGLPLLSCLHTPAVVVERFTDRAERSRLRASDRLEAAVVARADAVTAPSRLLVDELTARGWLTRPDVSIVAPPLPAGMLPPSAGPRTHPEDPDDDPPIVLGVGRVEPRKGFDLAVDALGLLTRHGCRARLVIVGGDTADPGGRSRAAWLAARAAARGVPLTFTGPLEAVGLDRWIGRARVVVVPSRFESWSMAGLEGMAAGRPVVVTDHVGLAELAPHAGRDDPAAALRVVAPTPAAVAAGLAPLVREPALAREAGRRARALVVRVLDPSAFAVARTRDYERAVASARRRHR